MRKVVLLKPLSHTGVDYLKANNCEVFISSGSTTEEYLKDMEGCEGLFVRNEKITAEMMDKTPALKVIAKHGIGYDNIDIDAATKRGIQVVYAPLGNINSVAEHAMMMILMCAKRYGKVEKEFKGGNYNIRYTLDDAHEVKGKTLGLVGCGNIAKRLAKKARYGLEMNVIGFDPYQPPGLNEWGIEIIKDRDELFKTADFISFHVPSTKESKHSVGKREFEMMKNSAYIVNTSRGDIIVEADLIDALNHDEIAGAGLDVFEAEPVDPDNTLLHMPNVIVTPHTAGMTVEASENLSYVGAKGIIEVLDGKDISFPVNHI